MLPSDTKRSEEETYDGLPKYLLEEIKLSSGSSKKALPAYRKRYFDLLLENIRHVPLEPKIPFEDRFFEIPSPTETFAAALWSLWDLTSVVVAYFLFLLIYSARLKIIEQERGLNQSYLFIFGTMALGISPLFVMCACIINRMEFAGREAIYYFLLRKGLILDFFNRKIYKSKMFYLILSQAFFVLGFGYYVTGSYDLGLLIMVATQTQGIYSFFRNNFNIEERLITLNKAIERTKIENVDDGKHNQEHKIEVSKESEIDAFTFIKSCKIIRDRSFRWLMINKILDVKSFRNCYKNDIKEFDIKNKGLKKSERKKNWNIFLKEREFSLGLSFGNILLMCSHVDDELLDGTIYSSWKLRTHPSAEFLTVLGPYFDDETLQSISIRLKVALIFSALLIGVLEIYGFYKMKYSAQQSV